MIKYIKSLFSKGDNDIAAALPQGEQAAFILMAENLPLAELRCKDGEWEFNYTDAFKAHQSEYNTIVGFPDAAKRYHSGALWPFFQIRIPGLKQPAIQEIIRREHLDASNEAELLKRFGRKTISNPYELVAV